MGKMLVEDLLHMSPLRLVTVQSKSSIGEATRRMAEFNIGLVVVMDDQDDVAGVLSERDIVRALGNGDTDIHEYSVGDLMKESVVVVSTGDTLVEAVCAMNTHGIRHLVAVDRERPVGVLSIRDVLRVFARQLLDNNIDTDDPFTQEFVQALAA